MSRADGGTWAGRLPAVRMAGDKPERYMFMWVRGYRFLDWRFSVWLWCVDSRVRENDEMGAWE